MESERNVNELQAFRASNKTNPEDMIDYLRMRYLRDLDTYRFIDRPRLNDFLYFLREKRPPSCLGFLVSIYFVFIIDITLSGTGLPV